MTDTTFGERVYRARLALQAKLGREVTQAEVGKRLGLTGQAVGLWEQGKSEPKLDVIKKLAGVLEVDPALLAFGISSTQEKPTNGNHATPANGGGGHRYEGPHPDERLVDRVARKKKDGAKRRRA